MMKLMVPKKHRVLLRFAKKNVLDDTSSGTEDESLMNIVKLANCKNEVIRNKTHARINKAFYEMKKGPMNEADFKVTISHFNLNFYILL
jgi:hypothetical protein